MTGVQTCALPISWRARFSHHRFRAAENSRREERSQGRRTKYAQAFDHEVVASTEPGALGRIALAPRAANRRIGPVADGGTVVVCQSALRRVMEFVSCGDDLFSLLQLVEHFPGLDRARKNLAMDWTLAGTYRHDSDAADPFFATIVFVSLAAICTALTSLTFA